MRARRAGACLLVVLSTGRVRRMPEPAGGRTGAPRVGWVIMSGDGENPGRGFVCQSNPQSECVVPVDRPEARVLAHVHLYYHSSAMEMTYTGSVRIGFFN